ncbi:hypothetical protein QG37_03079 [Candidozyma auris]|uniref:Uncharacterized protein n=1 Tax=Candidozyma auris TaxID=498019 RepID=A0A0L0P1H9_CANAR|nr:hypothetical protein QG37_03079 [[Candida] auris]
MEEVAPAGRRRVQVRVVVGHHKDTDDDEHQAKQGDQVGSHVQREQGGEPVPKPFEHILGDVRVVFAGVLVQLQVFKLARWSIDAHDKGL